jgi:AcrR family transcriptional regulator
MTRFCGSFMTTPTASAPTDSFRARLNSRARILRAALKLLATEGREALTTRAVAEAAGVQPPVLYRLFGDKQGVLDAAAEYGFTAYLAKKRARVSIGDPVEALRSGWDLHIDFGLTNPALYLLMYADPKSGKKSPAGEASFQRLCEHIRRVASAGRLRVNEERAAHLFHAAASGIVLTLLGMPQGKRDMTLSSIAREAALAAITTEVPMYRKAGSTEAAIALRAVLDDAAPLSGGERALLVEWLDRLASR